MAMTPRENYLATLRHEPHDYVPINNTDALMVGFGFLPGPSFEKGPGLDGFGVNWLTPISGGGAPIPEPGKFILDSETIVDWKKIVKFPDIAQFDWETTAKQELSAGDRSMQVVDFGSGNGPYERLAALMGFEEALIAMVLEPEACRDLCDAIADYKCDVASYVKKYYDADTFTNYDDIATERGLFMSPESYRYIIKPAHIKMNKAVKDLDMIPIQHTCGKADALIEDYIETGAEAWTCIQTVNDLPEMLKKYGDRFAFMGGFNMNGAPGRPDSTAEELVEETERCFREYAFSPAYMFMGGKILATYDFGEIFAAMGPIIQTCERMKEIYRFDQ